MSLHQTIREATSAVMQEPPLSYPTSSLEHANIYITPIAKTYKTKEGQPCSRGDWEEQISRSVNGSPLVWDGPPLTHVQPRIGDLMVVWKHKKHVTIYGITDVRPPSDRLPTWSMNIGQSERQVLTLENPRVIGWDSWIALGGASRCMGTSIVKSSRENIIRLLTRE
jgi:hypothetical protein